jgi:hypothetical protein
MHRVDGRLQLVTPGPVLLQRLGDEGDALGDRRARARRERRTEDRAGVAVKVVIAPPQSSGLV